MADAWQEPTDPSLSVCSLALPARAIPACPNPYFLSQRQRLAHIQHHRAADDLGRTIEVAEWNCASSINRNPQPRLAHPGHRPPPPARGLGPALQHHPRADRDLRRPPPPPLHRRRLQGIGLDPCRSHPRPRALRPRQAVLTSRKRMSGSDPFDGIGNAHSTTKVFFSF